MPKPILFTMKLEPELRDAFFEAATAAHQSASQVVRALMRDYVQQQRDALEYEAFLRGKVSVAHEAMRLGQGRPHADIEAEFAERRTRAERAAPKDSA